jgi:adenosylcobinamide-GDP ribazoletransferase
VDELSKNFWLIPIIGAFYGIVAGLLYYGLTRVLNTFVSAIIVIMVVHILNRFLHFDGLIDVGDGLVATGPREKKLAAMKDTRVGAGGVSYGILFTILIIGSLSSVPALFFFAPLAMEVLAKNSLLSAAAFGKEREGLGSPFVKNTSEWAVIYSSLLSLALLLVAALAFAAPTIGLVNALIVVVALVLASDVAGLLMASLAMHNFGCVNGDVLGATNEISKAAVLLTLLAVLAWVW